MWQMFDKQLICVNNLQLSDTLFRQLIMTYSLKIRPNTGNLLLYSQTLTYTTRGDLAWGLSNTFFIFLYITGKTQSITKYWCSSNQTSTTGTSQTNLPLPLCALFHTGRRGRTRQQILSGLDSIGSAFSAAETKLAPSLPSLPRLELLVRVGGSLLCDRCKESKTYWVWCSDSHWRDLLLNKYTVELHKLALVCSHRGSPNKYACEWAT